MRKYREAQWELPMRARLRLAPAYGYSDDRSPGRFPVSMNSARSPLRSLINATGLALVGLVCAAPLAHAAPRPGRASGSCDPQTTTLRKLMRTPKSFGGPVAKRSRRVRIVVPDATARLRRGTRTNFGEGTAAIQNNTSVARIDADDCPVPALQPLGLLAGPFELQPRSHAFSPRSPRGPPSVA